LEHGGRGPQGSSFELVCQKLTAEQEDCCGGNQQCGALQLSELVQKGLDFRLEWSVSGPTLVERGGFRAAPLARREVGVASAAEVRRSRFSGADPVVPRFEGPI
jgi:hypothetical protein